MNALVIYDSTFGNTKAVAEEIVNNLDGNAKTLSVNMCVLSTIDDSVSGIRFLARNSPVFLFVKSSRRISPGPAMSIAGIRNRFCHSRMFLSGIQKYELAPRRTTVSVGQYDQKHSGVTKGTL